MCKKFVGPEMEVEVLSVEDVITTSTTEPIKPTTDGDDL